MGYAPTPYGREILTLFGLEENSLVGQGSSSRIFAADLNHVLRIHRPGTSRDYVEEIARFYESLDGSNASFQTPKIREIGVHKGLVFSVELLLGHSLERGLQYLSPKELVTALESYVDAVGQIRSLKKCEYGFFGEIFGQGQGALRADSWPEYLLASAERSVSKVREHLIADIPEFESLYQEWKEGVTQLGQHEEFLVHGDYFPGNVIIDSAGVVDYVIDFGEFTLVGDWRLDAVNSFIQADLGGINEKNKVTLKRLIDEKYKIDPKIFRLYTIYQSLLYVQRRELDPDRVYKWCLRNLNAL